MLLAAIPLSCAAMAALGCGSASPPPHLRGLPPLPANATPKEIVQHAFVSLAHSSYVEQLHGSISIDTSKLPPLEAARVQAHLPSLDKTFSGSITVEDFANLTARVNINGTTVYFKASDGTYLGSEDGINYQAVPSNAANAVLGLLQNNITNDPAHITGVVDLGARTTDTVKVERYRATFPGAFVAQNTAVLLGALGKQAPTGATFRPIMTVDVDRATGFPVRISIADTVTSNLANQHKPGVTGLLIVHSQRTLTYSSFRAHTRGATSGK